MMSDSEISRRRNTFLKLRLKESGHTMNAEGHTYWCNLCSQNIGSGSVGHFRAYHKDILNSVKVQEG